MAVNMNNIVSGMYVIGVGKMRMQRQTLHSGKGNNQCDTHDDAIHCQHATNHNGECQGVNLTARVVTLKTDITAQ
jgi:hypothetical protein